jgi:hypothetical protein
VLALALACLVGAPASGSQEYIIEGIPPPTGLRFGWGLGSAPKFARSGKVLGTLSTSSENDRFLWNSTDGFQFFSRVPEGGRISIDNVNASGVGVGFYASPSSSGYYWATPGIEPIFYKPAVGYINIGQYPLQSDLYSVKSTRLFDITADGVAVGTYFYTGQNIAGSAAFQWSELNGFETLPMTAATMVNSVGAILNGHANGILLPDGTYHTIRFGTMLTQLAALNDSNTVVGSGQPSGTSNSQPYAWTPDSGARLLGTPAGSLHHYPYAVNASGAVAGYSLLPFVLPTDPVTYWGEQAVLWHSNGQHFRLNDLAFPGWDLTRATDIADDGRIIGLGAFNGESTMFLLTPVPEPNVIIVVAFLSLACIFYRWHYGGFWPGRHESANDA